jgi:LPXTG-motif cell wall-anchored protein
VPSVVFGIAGLLLLGLGGLLAARKRAAGVSG